MKEYKAPQAQIISFDNDYVIADNQNKSWSKGCDWTCSTPNHRNGEDYSGSVSDS